jgi:phosphatidylserine/phosphatidylglycerophosphate/cardiolipin synthase-like enzyme
MLRHVRAGPAEVRLVHDDAYPRELRRLIREASERVWCSLFLIDVDPRLDRELEVAGVLRDLATARWRGVDVRLLIGGSRSNLEIAQAAATAFTIASRLRIPTRGLGERDLRGSHCKVVVADDWVLTGSHNWSVGAFSAQIQDSVAVHSRDLAAYCANAILEQWRRGDPGSGA